MKRKACSACGKRRNEDKFRADGRTTDGLATVCEACRLDRQETDAHAITRILEATDAGDRLALLTRAFQTLPTVDIPAVPILAAGGPYFGTGSPPEGDFFSKADLEEIAEFTNTLEQAGELRPPSKLGHSEEQRLLNNSGLPVTDELPAAGWLTNFRVEEIAGTWKLLADVKCVPAKLGQILASGGYRTRSVELSRVIAQDGTVYEGVVTGLAWLGAKAPAVRTLDDVWNLYATGDVVWEEEEGIMDLLADLTAAINREIAPDEPSYMWELWVNDVNLAMDKCTASDWDSDTTWIIGFTVGADNEPTVDPRDQWTPSTMKLVEIDQADADPLGNGGSTATADEEFSAGTYLARRAEARAKFRERAADSKGMKLTDDQVKAYAKAFEIDGEGDALRSKVEEHLAGLAGTTEEPKAETAPVVEEPATELTQALAQVEAPEGTDEKMFRSFTVAVATAISPVLAKLGERADRGDQAYRTQFARTRDGEILKAIGEGRLNPADREQWVTFYDAQPELALASLQKLPVNPLYLVTYGTDVDGVSFEQRQETDDAAGDAWVALTAPETIVPKAAA